MHHTIILQLTCLFDEYWLKDKYVIFKTDKNYNVNIGNIGFIYKQEAHWPDHSPEQQ